MRGEQRGEWGPETVRLPIAIRVCPDNVSTSEVVSDEANNRLRETHETGPISTDGLNRYKSDDTGHGEDPEYRECPATETVRSG